MAFEFDRASISSGTDSLNSGDSKRSRRHPRGGPLKKEMFVGVIIGTTEETKKLLIVKEKNCISLLYRVTEHDTEDRSLYLITSKLVSGFARRGPPVDLVSKDATTRFLLVDLAYYEQSKMVKECEFLSLSEVRRLAKCRNKVHPRLRAWLVLYDEYIERLEAEKNKVPTVWDW